MLSKPSVNTDRKRFQVPVGSSGHALASISMPVSRRPGSYSVDSLLCRFNINRYPVGPLQHSGGTAATQANGIGLTFHRLLNVENADLPLPQVQGVADIKELFLPVRLELVQCFRPRVPAKTVELLPVDADNVAQIVILSKNGPEDVVELGQPQAVRNRN